MNKINQLFKQKMTKFGQKHKNLYAAYGGCARDTCNKTKEIQSEYEECQTTFIYGISYKDGYSL